MFGHVRSPEHAAREALRELSISPPRGSGMNRETSVHWQFSPELGVIIDRHDRLLSSLEGLTGRLFSAGCLRQDGAAFGHMNRFE